MSKRGGNFFGKWSGAGKLQGVLGEGEKRGESANDPAAFKGVASR